MADLDTIHSFVGHSTDNETETYPEHDITSVTSFNLAPIAAVCFYLFFCLFIFLMILLFYLSLFF